MLQLGESKVVGLQRGNFEIPDNDRNTHTHIPSPVCQQSWFEIVFAFPPTVVVYSTFLISIHFLCQKFHRSVLFCLLCSSHSICYRTSSQTEPKTCVFSHEYQNNFITQCIDFISLWPCLLWIPQQSNMKSVPLIQLFGSHGSTKPIEMKCSIKFEYSIWAFSFTFAKLLSSEAEPCASDYSTKNSLEHKQKSDKKPVDYRVNLFNLFSILQLNFVPA